METQTSRAAALLSNISGNSSGNDTRARARLRLVMRVLIVEDDRKIADPLRDGLRTERYDVTVERTGEGALSARRPRRSISSCATSGLPGCDGLVFSRQLAIAASACR
ncbi:MAG: hypothetical protein GEU82_05250 [Luteitalea sp.]|nr:hypothetical protein [Luteitalea sp.]